MSSWDGEYFTNCDIKAGVELQCSMRSCIPRNIFIVFNIITLLTRFYCMDTGRLKIMNSSPWPMNNLWPLGSRGGPQGGSNCESLGIRCNNLPLCSSQTLWRQTWRTWSWATLRRRATWRSKRTRAWPSRMRSTSSSRSSRPQCRTTPWG